MTIQKFLFYLLVSVATCVTDACFAASPELGTKAPDIKVAHWISKPIKDGSIIGKTVVLEFWGTWCPPCRKMIPHMNKLSSKFAGENVVFISLTYESPEVVKTFLKKTKMNTSVVVDNNYETWKAYGISSVPTVFVINDEGIVSWQGHPYNLTEEQLTAVR